MSKSIAGARRTQRAKRHRRVRKKVRGTADRPRLVVFRSLKNMEGQLVNDDLGVTLLGVSTRLPLSVDSEKEMSTKVAASFAAGKHLAEKARESGIEGIVFDRGGYQYHGRVKAFADGARAGGLDF
ncbi:MAG: 50S ribosomal protein L18 [Gemmatimonadales bacterium]|nr:MAG: 50S ribosomal protein L18 [Gemmatimonadales bacterium]